jgi:sulfide:quinone oxidoreductase
MADGALKVVVAGGGVAALEASLALRELAGRRVRVELLAPEPSFWYRPVAVAEPFGRGVVSRFDLGELADAAGAAFTLGSLVGVDADRREATTTSGTFPFDALLIATGAAPSSAIPGALTFRGPADTERFARLLEEIVRGDVHSVAFASSWGAGWLLPLYELALQTAEHLASREVHGVQLTLVTPEDAPLQLFGRTASQAVSALLGDAGVGIVTGAYAVEARAEELVLTPEGTVAAERVVALPRLRGQRLDGVPQTVEGFVPVDEHCRVLGMDCVYAAGDITSFPVKQGGIAAQQAEAAVEAILAHAGLAVEARPFEPVLRGLLLTGHSPRYLRHELGESAVPADEVSERPLWWPPAKIVGRRLAPFLASLSGGEATRGTPPSAGRLRIEARLADADVDRLSAASLAVPPSYGAVEGGATTVGDVMFRAPLVVGPDVTLDALAKRLREREAASALVVDGGELVGILTPRDLLRAMAAGVDPREALVRQWMTAEPVTVDPSAALSAAEVLMTEYGIHHLPVLEDGRVVGLLGLSDAVRLRRRSEVAPIGLGF